MLSKAKQSKATQNKAKQSKRMNNDQSNLRFCISRDSGEVSTCYLIEIPDFVAFLLVQQIHHQSSIINH
jgi:hypothetical protein